VNARKDLAALYDHCSLEAKSNAMGKLRRPKAPYCLKPTEIKEVLRWLKTLKFLDLYVANIKQAVNVGTGKLNGLKSHDYHILKPICGRYLLNSITSIDRFVLSLSQRR
jgi:hypothetical protein